MDIGDTLMQRDRDGRGFTVRVPVPEHALLLRLNANHKPTHVKFQVSYDVGGASMFGGQPRARGYRIRITPVECGDHVETTVCMGGFHVSGGYSMLETVKAFNAKRLNAWAAAVTPHIPGIVTAFLGADQAEVVRLCEAVKL